MRRCDGKAASRCKLSAVSTAPPPGTTALDSKVRETAHKASWTSRACPAPRVEGVWKESEMNETSNSCQNPTTRGSRRALCFVEHEFIGPSDQDAAGLSSIPLENLTKRRKTKRSKPLALLALQPLIKTKSLSPTRSFTT